MNKISSNIVIRISSNSLSFAYDKGENEGVCFEPYALKNGISLAANLREAFKTSELLNIGVEKAIVLVDAPTLIIPLEEYVEEEADEQYKFVYPGMEGMGTEKAILPAFKNIAVFGISKDLRMVLTDHFDEVKFRPLMFCVWEFLLQRNINGTNRKLFAYFHDGKMDICSFARNRFVFSNSFEVQDIHDALYFLLGVWKNVGCKALNDDVFLLGDIAEREVFTEEAKKFLRRIYYINPSADFNRAQATQITNMPFDMMLLFL